MKNVENHLISSLIPGSACLAYGVLQTLTLSPRYKHNSLSSRYKHNSSSTYMRAGGEMQGPFMSYTFASSCFALSAVLLCCFPV